MKYQKTNKELVVAALNLNQEGKTNLEIATTLNVSEATVSQWFQKLKKLGVVIKKTSKYGGERVDWAALAQELK